MNTGLEKPFVQEYFFYTPRILLQVRININISLCTDIHALINNYCALNIPLLKNIVI
ncbi:hypothetical protein ACF8C4_00320 [Myroides odoratimimus]|uniref:hypothetical protein n=1 Tax=Myroides odoratimimus TaxID=76832 RepID=UPI001428C74F|nr:hypothetical protein [Myroides odoratimimus]MDM1487818.1 hypothetical protein [Myroides odoratimimus]MEC4149680.1 hypothetical protein [Myroides odoratimimus]